MSNLPYSDSELINVCRDEFENCKGKPDYPDAAFRFGWALVHSRRREDVSMGLHILEGLLDRHRRQLAAAAGDPTGSTAALQQQQRTSIGPSERELLYTMACAHFRLTEYVQARTALRDLLTKFPESAQARALLSETEDAIVKDGLVTAGVATGLVVIGGVLLGALLGGKGKH